MFIVISFQCTCFADEVNAVKVSFTVSKSGTYEVAVSHNSTPILDSPFRKEFLPGYKSVIVFVNLTTRQLFT